MRYIKISIFALALTAVALIISGQVEKTMVTSVGVGNNSCTTAGDRELPVYCVETDKNVVAISFDAAWGNEDTDEILSILDKNDVKATFFMTGGWVENYPEDVKKIYAAGHDLANHSENHKNMSQLSNSDCKEELQKVKRVDSIYFPNMDEGTRRGLYGGWQKAVQATQYFKS